MNLSLDIAASVLSAAAVGAGLGPWGAIAGAAIGYLVGVESEKRWRKRYGIGNGVSGLARRGRGGKR